MNDTERDVLLETAISADEEKLSTYSRIIAGTIIVLLLICIVLFIVVNMVDLSDTVHITLTTLAWTSFGFIVVIFIGAMIYRATEKTHFLASEKKDD